MTEPDGKRPSAWATSIQVDDSGTARAVRSETLANLVPSTQTGSEIAWAPAPVAFRSAAAYGRAPWPSEGD